MADLSAHNVGVGNFGGGGKRVLPLEETRTYKSRPRTLSQHFGYMGYLEGEENGNVIDMRIENGKKYYLVYLDTTPKIIAEYDESWTIVKSYSNATSVPAPRKYLSDGSVVCFNTSGTYRYQILSSDFTILSDLYATPSVTPTLTEVDEDDNIYFNGTSTGGLNKISRTGTLLAQNTNVTYANTDSYIIYGDYIYINKSYSTYKFIKLSRNDLSFQSVPELGTTNNVVAISKEGKMVYTYNNGNLQLWDAQTGNLKTTSTIPATSLSYDITYCIDMFNEGVLWVMGAISSSEASTVLRMFKFNETGLLALFFAQKSNASHNIGRKTFLDGSMNFYRANTRVKLLLPYIYTK